MEDVTGSASAANTQKDTDPDIEGVEAAEEEPPAELQQLLQRLEGKLESGSEDVFPVATIELTVDGKYGDVRYWSYRTAYNSYKLSGKFRMVWGTQAKHKLLQAIGSCRTIRKIDLRNLTIKEVVDVLTPLPSNTVLEAIVVRNRQLTEPTGDSGGYIENTCVILGRILNTSRTFKTLVLDTLTATGAYHLASGLRGNSESALAELVLAKLEEPSVVKHIAKIVLSAPRLRRLELWTVGVVDDDGIDALAHALRQTTSLKLLTLGDMERGASALLLKVFTGEGSNQSMTSLHLASIQGIGEFLPLLLSSNQSLKEFTSDGLEQENLSPNQWRRLGQSLCSSSSLECFQLHWRWSSRRTGSIDGLEDLLSAADMKKPRIELYFYPRFDFRWNSPVDIYGNMAWTWSGADGAKELIRTIDMEKPVLKLYLSAGNKVWVHLANAVSSKVITLSSLHLRLAPWHRGGGPQVESFLEGLRHSSTLRKFTIKRGDGKHWPSGWKAVFSCLRHNTSITNLELINCKDLDDEVFKDLMGVLQVNLTLKTIELKGCSWETDGKAALITEALRRNEKQDSYFAIFREAKLKFDGVKAGRLFLCGSPHAGKTRLRQTMMRIVRKTSWFGDKAAQLLRTKGIEVELLRDDQDMQITVWDLAGQWIFRTLQDTLFPRTSHSSIFLFVFSPYDRENRCIKKDLDQSFKLELEEWLRFIASNSQITGRMLPKVVVVISHMDKMEKRDVRWAERIVRELSVDFENILDICNSERLYQIDARRKKDVTPVKDFVFETFGELLEQESPIVPKVCSQMSSIFANRTKDSRHHPVWPSQDFYNFCFNNLQDDAVKSLRPETPSGLEVFKAMASYLHDTGSIIAIPSLDRIIVDPNWLTYVFLGELIAMGQNFQVNSSAIQTSEGKPFSSKTGFVSSSDLHHLLSSFLGKHPELIEVDTSFLENLLIHFDLCYKVDIGQVNARYYIPTIVCEDESFRVLDHSGRTGTRGETLSWSSSPESNRDFIGFRVQCQNSRRMSMTAALFPRFQIYIWHKLMMEMNLTKDVTCSRTFMHLCMNGHEIFVERSDLAKSHIDVMVKCSKHKSRGTTIQYVQKYILDELISFCASPKGCPGIALVVGILQTKCVEKLIPLECRGDNQAILVEKLKELFERSIMDNLEEMKPESWSENANMLLDYEHSWPPVPGYLLQTFELARDLLEESVVESVTEKARQYREQQLETLDRVSIEMSKEIDHAQAASGMVAAVEVGTVSLAPAEDSKFPTRNNCYTSQPTIKRMFMDIGGRFDKLVDKVDGRFDKLEDKVDGRFDRLEATLSNIVTLQAKVQSSLTIVMSKMDQIIGYAESSERAKTPRRPYLSFENVSIFHRITAAMRLGTPVRLHLMCESMVGPHIVKDQPGLDLCLGRENMEWLRCIYDISFKIMYYLVKAGLHVTLGLGQAVPELGSLEAALPLSVASTAMDNIKVDDSMISMQRSGNVTLDEAWSHLRSVLAPRLNDNYTVLFKLCRVKYLNLEEGAYAWVCDQCMTRGIRNRSLECI